MRVNFADVPLIVWVASCILGIGWLYLAIALGRANRSLRRIGSDVRLIDKDLETVEGKVRSQGVALTQLQTSVSNRTDPMMPVVRPKVKPSRPRMPY